MRTTCCSLARILRDGSRHITGARSFSRKSRPVAPAEMNQRNEMNTPMKYRRFGRTKLSMPVISCGGMRYQHSWKDEEAGGITAEGQANLEATIHRALELGINHIETARGYGTSEVQLGRILPSIPRDKIIVQTKIGPGATHKEF